MIFRHHTLVYFMPHNNSILVIHPDGEFYAQRARVAHLPEAGKAYWRDPGKTVLIILKSTDDQPSNGYEYVGRQSIDRFAIKKVVDLRTNISYDVPREKLDRTMIPVREPGGQRVMQWVPKVDRHASGRASKREDRLWHPGRCSNGMRRSGGPGGE